MLSLKHDGKYGRLPNFIPYANLPCSLNRLSYSLLSIMHIWHGGDTGYTTPTREIAHTNKIMAALCAFSLMLFVYIDTGIVFTVWRTSKVVNPDTSVELPESLYLCLVPAYR